MAVGLLLRWSLNGTWRLSPDEALYGFWARQVASGKDFWLAATPGVDKPPLAIYAIALTMKLYGYTEFATRFPAIIAGTLSIPLTYGIARRLCSDSFVARLAALLLALSPFAVLFSPTAYPDMLMVMWLLAACLLAMSDRWACAGVPAGLAILTKQEAPLLLPVVVVLALAAGAGGMRRVAGLLAVCLVVAVLLEVGWEWVRPGQPSPFALGLAHYGGLGLVEIGEIPARLAAWWQMGLCYAFASWPLNLVTIVGGLALVVWPRHHGGTGDRALVLCIAYVVLVRSVLGFGLWERYVLVAVPLMCIVLARVGEALTPALGALLGTVQRLTLGVFRGDRRPLQRACARTAPGLAQCVLALVVVGLLVQPVREGLAGRIPVGGDHGRYWGIEDAADYLRENAPPGAVVYHRTLGWQFSFYLYGAVLDFWWYPSLTWLAETAAARVEHSQWIVVPWWEPMDPLVSVLGTHGLVLVPVHEARRPNGDVAFTTYRIAPRLPPGEVHGSLHK